MDEYEIDPEVGAVIQGKDYKFNYSKLAIGALYAETTGKWIVTNEDQKGTTKSQRIIPGTGSYVAAMEATLQNQTGTGLICSKAMTGKPNPEIISLIRRQHDIPESELSKFIMVGDNPTTDIALANNAGIDSLLVLTGVVKDNQEAHDYAAQHETYMPTYIMDSFGALARGKGF